MISGMLTRGKNCEDGVLCAAQVSEVMGGDAVYPKSMEAELLKNVGAGNLKGHEAEFIDKWLGKVQVIRDQQTKLFDDASDRVHLPGTIVRRPHRALALAITPFNVGYNPSIKSLWQDAFPSQYVAPTLSYIYGIEQPKQMRGRILTEIFGSSDNKVAMNTTGRSLRSFRFL
jgi:hypothetical protein